MRGGAGGLQQRFAGAQAAEALLLGLAEREGFCDGVAVVAVRAGKGKLRHAVRQHAGRQQRRPLVDGGEPDSRRAQLRQRAFVQARERGGLPAHLVDQQRMRLFHHEHRVQRPCAKAAACAHDAQQQQHANKRAVAGPKIGKLQNFCVRPEAEQVVCGQPVLDGERRVLAQRPSAAG